MLIEVLVYLWLPERPFPPRHHTAELPAPVPACRSLEQLEVPHASCTVPQVDLRSLRLVTLTAASRTRQLQLLFYSHQFRAVPIAFLNKMGGHLREPIQSQSPTKTAPRNLYHLPHPVKKPSPNCYTSLTFSAKMRPLELLLIENGACFTHHPSALFSLLFFICLFFSHCCSSCLSLC